MKNISLIFLFAVAAGLSGCASLVMPEGATDDTSKLIDQITLSLKSLDQKSLDSAFESHRLKHGNRLFVGEPGILPSYYHLEDIQEKSNQALVELIKCNSSMERNRSGKIDKDWLQCTHMQVLDSYRSLPKKPNMNEIIKRFEDYQVDLKTAEDVKRKARLERARFAKLKAEEDEKKQILEQKEAEERKEKDPKTWSERACYSQQIIDISKNTIKREQAGAKHSGVVNQRALYGAGQTIEIMQSEQSKQKAEFKKLSGGKDWSPELCK